MPKIKTHRGAAKRFKATASGLLKKNRPSHSHLLTHKTRKRKRQMRRPGVLTGADARNLKQLLPYL